MNPLYIVRSHWDHETKTILGIYPDREAAANRFANELQSDSVQPDRLTVDRWEQKSIGGEWHHVALILDWERERTINTGHLVRT